ncbi:MAG: arginase family protein [Thermoleophilia bacterium]
MALTPKMLAGNPDAPKRIALLGVPFDNASSLGRPGARYAPTRIRTALGWNLNRVRNNSFYDVEAGRIIHLDDYGVMDYGDCFIAGYDQLETFNHARLAMAEVLQAGAFPIALGGDHEVSIPLLQAFHDQTEGPLGIIHVDAHLDLVDENPRQGRFSGSSPMRRALEMGRFNAKNLVQVGVRGFNYPDQFEYIADQGIHHITALKVHEIGGQAAAERAVEIASRGGAQIYLSFDMDALDYAFAPGTGGDEGGGLTSAQILQFMRMVAPRVEAMDIVEVNPMVDQQDATSGLAAQIIFTVISSRVSAGC